MKNEITLNELNHAIRHDCIVSILPKKSLWYGSYWEISMKNGDKHRIEFNYDAEERIKQIHKNLNSGA